MVAVDMWAAAATVLSLCVGRAIATWSAEWVGAEVLSVRRMLRGGWRPTVAGCQLAAWHECWRQVATTTVTGGRSVYDKGRPEFDRIRLRYEDELTL